MTNVAFIRDMQAWVWKRFPSRQLSAIDIYYAQKWSESGVPSHIFTDAFEHMLRERNCEFEASGKLSTLRFEASRIIADYLKILNAPTNVPPVTLDEPYEKALERIAQIGRDHPNPLLLAELRTFYRTLLDTKSAARKAYPEYHARIESYYAYKAHAILAWDQGLEALLARCAQLLSEEETDRLNTLTPSEKIHCMQLSADAQAHYKKQIFQKKIAE
ncbi:MAG: hypothetical protein IKY83_03600, partial [Proteobacteria bacterium]|nr:hypothetical protein [Pseudomonadota bacterium]